MSSAAAATTKETHISRLEFSGDVVRKFKKPVQYAFLDMRTVERRLELCRREVELNRRFSPDVYLGVDEVRDEHGVVVDCAVVMRRMPEERRLAAIALAGGGADEVRDVARIVAAAHARAARGPAISAVATASALRELWHRNLDEMASFADDLLPAAVLSRIGRRADAYLSGRGPLLERRITDGWIVDGHGDLLAEDIFCLDDGPRILDCLEFDDRLRWGDVLYDTGFLAMDLERLGRSDLAHLFLESYREFSNENHPASLEHHYVAYRALVRTKIACLRTDRPAAELHLSLCDRHLDAALPRLVVVGGLPGTGKTTLARALAKRLGAAVLSSDEVRKERAGVPSTSRAREPFEQGLYAPAVTDATYEVVFDRALLLLQDGENVVVDASFAASKWRDAARRIGSVTSAELTELRCVLPVDEAERRLADRDRAGTGASDADAAIAARMAAQFDAWPEAVELDARHRPADLVGEAYAAVR